MKILIGCLSFKTFTGSEVSFFELATGLRDLGHDVSIFSTKTGSPLTDSLGEHITIEDSQSILNKSFDLVLFSHGSSIWNTIKNADTNKFINIIRSEVLSLEQPVIDDSINTYVSIRPSIQSYLLNTYNIESKLIYNPFDVSRFNTDINSKTLSDRRVVLFPGSLDYLRIKPVEFLLNLSELQNFKVIHVGRCDYNISHDNFETHPSTNKMETYYADCDIVSGIFLGRTSIEGLLCGKKVYQFDVDERGNILKHYWHTEDNLSKFDKSLVAEQYVNLN